ncbi:MAG: beta-hexosaminidase, partial [Alphaproteobacteria bacterium]|nr:beta-hexosaminidase [Alphaproteobacteria bacterium]
AAPWAMTGHVVYDAIDPDAPATISATLVRRLIRKAIGFKGLLLSDDLAMKALSGSPARNAAAALAAGCDIALHCPGRLDEMKAIAAAVPALSPASLRRVRAGRRMAARAARAAPPFDRTAALVRLDALLSRVA